MIKTNKVGVDILIDSLFLMVVQSIYFTTYYIKRAVFASHR